MMLPPTLPIFPLPNVVLFPNVFLPLHIFEPRYREMVADALEGDRLIGMVLLRPGWEGQLRRAAAGLSDRLRRASSRITTALPDGRYNIVLRGLEKFRIVEEDDQPCSIGWRRSRASTSRWPRREREEIRAARRRLETLLVPQPAGRGADPKVPPAMTDEDLVNTLAQYMELEPVEKQALLERDGLLARCRSLIELLEMKMIVARHDWGGRDTDELRTSNSNY